MLTIYNAAGLAQTEAMRERGIDLTTDRSKAVAAVINTRRCGMLSPDRAMPHIHIIENDAATFYGQHWRLIDNALCIGVAKSACMTDWTLPQVAERHHLTHIPGAPEPVTPRVPRVPVVPWLDLIHLPRLEPFARTGEAILQTGKLPYKPSRSFFAGTVNYRCGEPCRTLLETHRKKIAERYGDTGRPYRKDEYAAKLAQTNVAISPWGFGEACWRDWEALLLGCAVVKPACPWVVTATGLYQLGKLMECRADWLDLDAYVEMWQDWPHRLRMEGIEWALAQRARRDVVEAEALAKLLEGVA